MPPQPTPPPPPPKLVLYAIKVQTGIVQTYFSRKCMRIKTFVQIRTGVNTQVCQRCMTRLDSREKCCRFTMKLSHLGKCQNLVCLMQQSYRIMKCSIHLPKKGLVTLKTQGKYWKWSVNYKVTCVYQWGEVYGMLIKREDFWGRWLIDIKKTFDQEDCNSAPSWWLHQQQTWVDCLSTTNLELLTRKNRKIVKLLMPCCRT